MFRKKQYLSSSSLSRKAMKRFSQNRLAVGATVFVCITLLIAVLGYLITPDDTPYANQQFLELTTKKPGFSVEMLLLRKNETLADNNFFNTMINGRKSEYTAIPVYRYSFNGDKIIVEVYTGANPNDGEIMQLNMADVVYALQPGTTPLLLPDGNIRFTGIDGNQVEKSSSGLRAEIEKHNITKKTFVLGTDRFGRDLLSQLLIGTRVSLSVGFISVLISLIIGILFGALAGYFRGWVDNLIVWLINVIWSIPTLLLVIAITFALGKGFWQVFVAVGLTMWVEVARVVRGQILSIREKEFVEAGKALGYRSFRIIFRHILPNVMGAVIVISAANFASAILIEAGLSFLGIGVQPPMPSWGTMIKEHYAYIILDAAYLAIIPGIAIMLMVLAFMLIGNALRDALDVKTVSR